jgi:hypothetical protein
VQSKHERVIAQHYRHCFGKVSRALLLELTGQLGKLLRDIRLELVHGRSCRVRGDKPKLLPRRGDAQKKTDEAEHHW